MSVLHVLEQKTRAAASETSPSESSTTTLAFCNIKPDVDLEEGKVIVSHEFLLSKCPFVMVWPFPLSKCRQE